MLQMWQRNTRDMTKKHYRYGKETLQNVAKKCYTCGKETLQMWQ